MKDILMRLCALGAFYAVVGIVPGICFAVFEGELIGLVAAPLIFFVGGFLSGAILFAFAYVLEKLP